MNRRTSGFVFVTGLALVIGLLGIGLLAARPHPTQLQPDAPQIASVPDLPAVEFIALNASPVEPARASIAPSQAEQQAVRVLQGSTQRPSHTVRTLEWQPHSDRSLVPPPATRFLLDLPTITVQANVDGALHAGPLPVAQLSDLGITPDLVGRLSAADIQHVQIASTEGGFFVEANNLPVLGMKWDRESLGHIGNLLAQTGTISDTVAKAVPLLSHINLDVVADLAPITRRPDREAVAVDPAIRQTDPAILADAAGRESITLELPIRYQKDGTPRVLGLGALQLEMLTGVSLSATQLTADQITTLSDAGIEEIRLSTEPDGLHIYLNDDSLTTLLWAQGEIGNLVELAAVLIDPEAGEDGEAMVILTDILGMVEQLVRLMQIVNVNVVIQFP